TAESVAADGAEGIRVDECGDGAPERCAGSGCEISAGRRQGRGRHGQRVVDECAMNLGGFPTWGDKWQVGRCLRVCRGGEEEWVDLVRRVDQTVGVADVATCGERTVNAAADRSQELIVAEEPVAGQVRIGNPRGREVVEVLVRESLPLVGRSR